MSISAEQKSAVKTALVYLCFALFTALFGAIYELFSHEVYSYFMIYAFSVPLLFGALPCLVCALRSSALPCRYARLLFRAGTATLTVGSLVKGVLEIYGTSNMLWFLYPFAGGLCMIAGVCLAAFTGKKRGA